MSASMYGAPQNLNKDVDSGKFKKLAQRVEEALTTPKVNAEPEQIDPQLILVAPTNRNGAPPNVQHVHMGILKSFIEKGYDRTRPAIGICIQYLSEHGKAQLLEHNKRFSKGNVLLPPINDQAMYGSVAASHFNLALRIIAGGLHSPAGPLDPLLEENAHLKEVVLNGHKWWILPETVDLALQEDISHWRNMDQNDNQQTHEIEILQCIRTTAETLSQKRPKITQGDLVAFVSKRNPTNLSPGALQTLCKFYIQFLENEVLDLVGGMVDFHCDVVDPKVLSISISFFQAVVSEESLKKCPFARLYLVITQYTTEKVRAQAGGPSVSQFLDVPQIQGLCKKPDQLLLLETTIREIRNKYLPLLSSSLGDRVARLEVAVYIGMIMRCLFAKPWPLVEPRVLLPVGKFSAEKIKDLAHSWAKVVDHRHPSLNFAASTGLLVEDKESLMQREEDSKELNLDPIRKVTRCLSDGPEPDLGSKFTKGDEVTVTRRVSWVIPQPDDPKYKKDINVGTEGGHCWLC